MNPVRVRLAPLTRIVVRGIRMLIATMIMATTMSTTIPMQPVRPNTSGSG